MVEISGGKGAKVRCVAEGTVGHISKSSGNHYIVKIAHGKNFYSVYTHVSKVCVKVGDTVKANQQIGVAGIFVDYNNQERAFIQFMIHNATTGELESVMKFFEK
jgi:septal ring factor EnvC (AmiA/AmiB activator)